MTVAALLQLRSRGEIKRWGAWLDGEGQAVRAELVVYASARGVDVADLDGKRLLRACLDRAQVAQVRTTPIARDEGFCCAHCGADVPPGGRRPRDHCPRCLYSLHVDEVPGDRAAECGGALVPIGLHAGPKGLQIRYRCARCGVERVNRVLDDVTHPDDAAVVRALSRR